MRLYKYLFNKNNISALIDTYSNYNPSPMSLKMLTDFGKPIILTHQDYNKNNGGKNGKNNKIDHEELINKTEIKSFEFLREELLVRLAGMMKEMLYLPEKLLKTSSVQLVHSWYMKSFVDIVEYKTVKTIDQNILKKFTNTLNHIVNRHADVVPTMALGILQLQENYGIDHKTEQSIQYFLDRFLTSRISVRMLINQHVLMFGDQKPDHPCHIGAIHTNCDVLNVLKDAYDNAKFLCDQYYLCSPSISYKCENVVEKDKNVEIVYVPSHLYHIAFELYKNAMRAIIEYHGKDKKEYPKIKTIVVKGKEDLTIRVTDFGGGISRSKIPYVFKYMYSTAPRPSLEANVYAQTTSAPLAGFGYGLPLSRLYARYFNGDLILSSIEGYSTDAYIYLKTLSSEANESLPIYSRKSVNIYTDKSSAGSDWTDSKRSQSHQVY